MLVKFSIVREMENSVSDFDDSDDNDDDESRKHRSYSSSCAMNKIKC